MLEKAFISVLNTATRIEVMYNPTELSNNYSVKTVGEGSNVQFQKVERSQFTISLFFDTYEKATDVRQETSQIEALLKPTVGEGSRRTPPICLFTWSKLWFTGIIVNLKQNFTMFLGSGIPVRAKLTVTFKSVLTQQEELDSLGLFNCPKLWTVKQGDRLDLIAYKSLGNCKYWQMIAEDNNIADPLHFPTKEDIGRILAIPDLHILNSH